jgi:hypothetical protein
MPTYYLAKANQEQLLREAEQDRLIKEARRAKREGSKRGPSHSKGWGNRRLHTTRA